MLYDPIRKQATEKYIPGIDWMVFSCQHWQESRNDHLAVSPAGAKGVAQLMDGTFEECLGEMGLNKLEHSPFDPTVNINCGIYYFSKMWKIWKFKRPALDRLRLALASYNAGPGSLLKAQKLAGGSVFYADIEAKLHLVTGERNSNETKSYVRLIINHWTELKLYRFLP